ncbi:MAG: glycosyltransferase family 4 protein [Spirochaetia bacterium]|nr:glycosyltransferase family 4 protein [Spirochaetia bacterium]
MKHIILDALAVENSKTGVGQYVQELLEELLERAPKDMFFSVMLHPDLNMKHPLVKFVTRRKNAEVMWFDIPAIGLKRDIKFFLKRRKLKCDLFHCLYSNHPLFFKGVQMVTIHDLKYVLHPEFMGSKGKLKSIYLKNLMRHAAKHCQKLIAVSESTRNDLLKVFPRMSGLPERTQVVYEAATVSMKTNQEIIRKFELDRPYFLYLGELRPHKNVGRVIQAFMQFKAQVSPDADIRLIVAGKPYKSFVMHADARRDDIIFTGYVKDDDAYTLYSNALAYCLPSLYEGFGLPILEAMKCGCPVITSDFSSTAEVAGDAGVLVDPLSVDAIADAMTKVYTDEAFRKELIEKGYAREKEFSWAEAAEQTLAIYREVLGR